jgi:hypothetical protein
VDRKKLDEILDELTVNDVLLMIEIAVEWLERARRIQQRLRRATSLLGVSGYTSREEMIYQMIAPMLQEEMRRKMGYTAVAGAVAETTEEREVDVESYSKLKSMLEKVKKEISGEVKKETSQVNSKQS